MAKQPWGYVVTPPMVALVALSTPATLVNVPANHTAKILELYISNANAGLDADVQLGHGTAPFVQDVPDIFVDQDRELGGPGAPQPPDFEFTASITVQEIAAAGAGVPVNVQAKVLIIPGSIVTT